MWCHLDRGVYSRPLDCPPVEYAKRHEKMVTTNQRAPAGILTDPDAKKKLTWQHMANPRRYREKWVQTGRKLWDTPEDELMDFYQALYREDVREGVIKVPTKEEVERRAAQSRADRLLATTDQQIADFASGKTVRIPCKEPGEGRLARDGRPGGDPRKN